MCTSPIYLSNPNFGQQNVGLNFLKDCENSKIAIPCGHCAECVAVRQSSFLQRVIVEAKFNHIFFCTLTYDNKHLPELAIEVPVVPTTQEPDLFSDLVPIEFESPVITDGTTEDPSPETWLSGSAFGDIETKSISLAFADLHDVQLLIKNLRDNFDFEGRSFKYVAVSELGKNKARPHFHILFFLEKKKSDFDPNGKPIPSILMSLERRLYSSVRHYWARNVGTRKNPVYEPLFTYTEKWYRGSLYKNFDLHWVDPSLTDEGEANVGYYVAKYMMKENIHESRRKSFLQLNLDDASFKDVWSIVKSRMVCSKGFGVNGHSEVILKEFEERVPLFEYSSLYDDYIASCDDLPDPDVIKNLGKVIRTKKCRVMIPDDVAMEFVRKDVLKAIGEKPYPVFVNAKGQLVPLARYYRKFSGCFSDMDAISIWFSFNPDNYASRKCGDVALRQEKDFKKKIKTAEDHNTFNNIAVEPLPDHFLQYSF